MDYYENGFLEELIALRTDSCESNMGMGMNINEEIYFNYNSGWQSTSGSIDLDYSFWDTTTTLPLIPPPCNTTTTAAAAEYFPFQQIPPPPPPQQQLPESLPVFHGGSEDDFLLSSILDPVQSSSLEAPCSFNAGYFPDPEKKVKSKNLHGQPSKNLMAERRRRKRLNDRLSMLRSVVPKISKMDRTSILGDTIDYMKELLGKIKNLEEEMKMGTDELSLMSIFKNVKPNEVAVKNSPKFEVESIGENDTKVDICCGGRPGLLLTTVTTLETLGLEIQQCVISCFNDFAMQASCTKGKEQREALSSESIRQALFRNAGYGGKCTNHF